MRVKIDDLRRELIGLKIIDIEPKGRAIHLKDEEGRTYSIDFTGKDGAIVYRGNTKKEIIESKLMLFDLLLQKLEIDESELWDLYEDWEVRHENPIQ